MLYIVLVLVLAAFGLLIASLATSTTLFAWASVGLSVLAAVVLVLDWWRRRRRRLAAEDDDADDDESASDIDGESTAEPVGDRDETAAEPAADDKLADGDDEPATVTAAEQVRPASPVDETTVLPRIDDPSAEPESELDLNAEPDEEDTDAADLLTVSELDVEVLVVDERPRYHLSGCRWLADKPTLPLAVSEARQLGFTPCAVCTPDARLVSTERKRQRAARKPSA